METIARIGPSIHIKGDVSAREPLSIAGHIDGTVSVDGHALTVDAGGQVKAAVSAQTIVIAGAVHGRLTADARIVVQDTATVDGDISAPAISVADGATVHGKIETSARTTRAAA